MFGQLTAQRIDQLRALTDQEIPCPKQHGARLLINALRGQLSEHGVVAPQGPANVVILAQAIDDMTASLPLLVVELARVYLDQIDGLSEKIVGLEKAIG